MKLNSFVVFALTCGPVCHQDLQMLDAHLYSGTICRHYNSIINSYTLRLKGCSHLAVSIL